MAKRLEDFIKDYLKDKSSELGVKGYAKWLSERGSDTVTKRADAMTRADTSYRTSLSEYGKTQRSLPRPVLTTADMQGTSTPLQATRTRMRSKARHSRREKASRRI